MTTALADPRTDQQTYGWSRRLLGLGGLAVVAAGLAYLFAFDPNQPGHYPACPTAALFGVDCPGCGTARALHALLHGDLARAADHNVLLVVVLPFVAAAAGYWAWSRFVRPLPERRLPARLGWGVLAVAVAFAVLRNLPWEPLTYLASGAS
jgi:hypothetical protein